MIPTTPSVTAEAAQLLLSEGFEYVDSGLVETDSTWLRALSHGSRQIMITLPPNASTRDVIDSLVDAGMKTKREYVKRILKALFQSGENDETLPI